MEQHLSHYFATIGIENDLTPRRMVASGKIKNGVTVPEHWFHGVAQDFQRIGVGINKPQEFILTPTSTISGSVKGALSLPSLAMRLLLLKVVGSTSTLRVAPKAESTYSCPRKSIASHKL